MFKIVKFDKNEEADVVCKELFKKGKKSIKKKTKILKGRITKLGKEQTDSLNENKIRDEVKKLLQNGLDSIPTKLKPKRKKKNQDKQKLLSVEENNTLIINGKEEKRSRNKNLVSCVKEEIKNAEKTIKKKKKKKNKQSNAEASTSIDSPAILRNKKQKKDKSREKLQQMVSAPSTISTSKTKKFHDLTLREQMMQRIQAAQFRILNEQIYSTDSKEAQKLFSDDPDSFTAYHEGYRLQVSKWPLNPVDSIISSIQKMPKNLIIADFGCGEAKLAKSVKQKVHSFDLVACDDNVTACDMAHVPLQSYSVDIAVFCLSLMGTNLHEYLLEANRVLKVGGILKVAEVESRFDDVNHFIEALARFHFKNIWTDLSHNLFYFLDFKKESNIKKKTNLPTVSLHPCLYKKR